MFILERANTNTDTNILAFESIFLPLTMGQIHRLTEFIVIEKKEKVANQTLVYSQSLFSPIMSNWLISISGKRE